MATAWIGDDYPPYLPIDLGDPVALVLEDSRHFALTSPDADAEWEAVVETAGLPRRLKILHRTDVEQLRADIRDLAASTTDQR